MPYPLNKPWKTATEARRWALALGTISSNRYLVNAFFDVLFVRVQAELRHAYLEVNGTPA